MSCTTASLSQEDLVPIVISAGKDQIVQEGQGQIELQGEATPYSEISKIAWSLLRKDGKTYIGSLLKMSIGIPQGMERRYAYELCVTNLQGKVYSDTVEYTILYKNKIEIDVPLSVDLHKASVVSVKHSKPHLVDTVKWKVSEGLWHSSNKFTHTLLMRNNVEAFKLYCEVIEKDGSRLYDSAVIKVDEKNNWKGILDVPFTQEHGKGALKMYNADYGIVYGANEIFEYKSGQGKILNIDLLEENDQISEVFFRSEKEYYILGKNELLIHFDNGKWNRRNRQDTTKLTFVTYLNNENGTEYLIALEQKTDFSNVIIYKGSGVQWEKHHVHKLKEKYASIIDAKILSNGNVIAVFSNSAETLHQFDGSQWSTLYENNKSSIRFEKIHLHKNLIDYELLGGETKIRKVICKNGEFISDTVFITQRIKSLDVLRQSLNQLNDVRSLKINPDFYMHSGVGGGIGGFVSYLFYTDIRNGIYNLGISLSSRHIMNTQCLDEKIIFLLSKTPNSKWTIWKYEMPQ